MSQHITRDRSAKCNLFSGTTCECNLQPQQLNNRNFQTVFSDVVATHNDQMSLVRHGMSRCDLLWPLHCELCKVIVCWCCAPASRAHYGGSNRSLFEVPKATDFLYSGGCVGTGVWGTAVVPTCSPPCAATEARFCVLFFVCLAHANRTNTGNFFRNCRIFETNDFISRAPRRCSGC